MGPQIIVYFTSCGCPNIYYSRREETIAHNGYPHKEAETNHSQANEPYESCYWKIVYLRLGGIGERLRIGLPRTLRGETLQ